MVETMEKISSGKGFPMPAFQEIVVADTLRDGYWIEALDINNDGRCDLVASGLAEGHVVWYENPINRGDQASYDLPWKVHPIRTFSKPVALVHADLTGDGYQDLVVCHDYGSCMFDCRAGDGNISWLRNPGQYDTAVLENWELRHISGLVATHRLQFGHFTQTHSLELLAFPVVGPKGVHEPIHVMLYQVPQDILNARSWHGITVDKSSFRVIHDVICGTFKASQSSSDLDTVLLACEEGVVCLYYDQRWQKAIIGTGEPPNPTVQPEVRRFKGSGNVAVGRMGSDPCAYIAALEPFHGNTVVVYTKENESQQTLTGTLWRRTILDVFGDQDKQSGEGNGHHVVTADFDGDGNDEFLVALRGPMPWQGVFYYKAIDLKNEVFVKTRISSSSAARITVADFDGDGRLDFATTSYYTPGYFLADNPQILVFLNDFAPKLA